MKVRDLIQILERNGFRCVRQRGSHRFFRQTGADPARVTVPGKDGDEVPTGTLAAIRRQSRLPGKYFR